MEIKQHYLVTLERVPERRYAWLGAQEAWDFDFNNLTLYYAADMMKYRYMHELCQLQVDAGIAYAQKGIDTYKDKHIENGLFAYNTSFMIAFHIVSQQEPGWYIVWEADCVLNVPYPGLRHLVQHAPSDANILLLSGIDNSWTETNEKFAKRQLCENNPVFYKGYPGVGATKCTAVTPAGAREILRVDEQFFPNAYDGMMACHSEEFQNLYTLATPITRQVKSSGVISTTRNPNEYPNGIEQRNVFNTILDSRGKPWI